MEESKVLAIAAGHEITESEVNNYIQNMPQDQRTYMNNPQARQQLLEQIIHLHLFSAYAKDLKLEETEEFKSVLEKVKSELLSNMAVTETIKTAVVSDEDIAEYYEKNKSNFVTPPRASAKHILVEDETKCNEILDEINSGAKTFEDAALAYSTCPSKERGGDLGTFSRGQMVPEFDEAVFTQEIGKVLGPVKTQFGYHLIRIEQRTDAVPQPLDAVKGQIRQQLLQAKQHDVFNAKVAELEEKYTVVRK